MSAASLLIRQIQQTSNHTFSIQWSDGQEQHFRLSVLQKNCPCANCVDEQTGHRLVDLKMIQEDVRAVSIRSIGRYALRIQFTSGCSTGIYSFEMLRALR